MNDIEKKAEEYAISEFPEPERPSLKTINECYQNGAVRGFQAGFRSALAEALPLIHGLLDLLPPEARVVATKYPQWTRLEDKAEAFLEKYEGEK